MQGGQGDPEKNFNSTTREFVIYLLLFIGLHFLSYALILLFRKKIAFYASDYEDAVVYRVSFWLCTFSLATSIEAALLLPISIISNEVLLFYPNSYYIQWLNSSLIQGFWNLAFLFSNTSLFILLPFAYFFTESQGFSGSHKGIKARVYETFAVLALLGLLILGMIYILSAIFDCKQIDIMPLFGVWTYYLPFLYSCVSFLGVLMLLLCTPTGFAHLFTVVGKLVVNPQLLECVIHEYELKQFEKTNVLVKLDCNGNGNQEGVPYVARCILNDELIALNQDLCDLGKVLKMTKLRRNVGYPVAMLFLLAFTVISVLMVAQNTLALCFGIKTLPIYSQKLSLGISSLSALGPLGAFLEIVLILYLWCSSVVGLYALPLLCRLRPKIGGTSMTHIIANCAVLLVLSSALPVLARTLGITNFDLLGDFGRIHWLGNFYIVLFYNVVFAVATAICLGTKITSTVRQELTFRLRSLAKMNFRELVSPLYIKGHSSKIYFKEE